MGKYIYINIVFSVLIIILIKNIILRLSITKILYITFINSGFQQYFHIKFLKMLNPKFQVKY